MRNTVERYFLTRRPINKPVGRRQGSPEMIEVTGGSGTITSEEKLCHGLGGALAERTGFDRPSITARAYGLLAVDWPADDVNRVNDRAVGYLTHVTPPSVVSSVEIS